MRRSDATCFHVYYRVAGDSASARERVAALIKDIEARTGIRGTLSARSDDPTTWMETYGPVARAASFRRLLATRALAHEAATLTRDGKRHVEEFAPLPPLLPLPVAPRRRKV